MNSDNNLHFESILSEWTDFCRLRDEGEDGQGLVWKKGEGRAYVLKVREGFVPSFNISLYMWERQKSGSNRAVSQEGDEKRR